MEFEESEISSNNIDPTNDIDKVIIALNEIKDSLEGIRRELHDLDVGLNGP